MQSEKSPFEVRSVQDFIETLDILGFSRGAQPERRENQHVVYRFSNPHFKRGQLVPDDLYKRTNYNQFGFKKTKRMLSTHSIKFIQTLLEKHHAPPLEITKLDLAHMKLQFSLEQQLDILAENAGVIEYSVVDPDYVKTKEIAGYYGDVPLNALKFAFQNYFPIYNTEDVEVPQMPAAPINPVWQMPSAASSIDQLVPVKKSSSKKRREEKREDEQALAFLHQESMAFSMEED